jgi:hypothetical protein
MYVSTCPYVCLSIYPSSCRTQHNIIGEINSSMTDYDLRPSNQRVIYVTDYAHPTFIPTGILGLSCPSWASWGVLWLVNSSLSWSETTCKVDICPKSRMAAFPAQFCCLASRVTLMDLVSDHKYGQPKGFFWDITPCSPLKFNRRFGRTCRLHLQGRKISQARNQRDSRPACQLLSQSQLVINVNICNKIRERCNDIERQNLFSEVNVKIC